MGYRGGTLQYTTGQPGLENLAFFQWVLRYAYDKNNNLETRRIAVLQLIIATFFMLKEESDL